MAEHTPLLHPQQQKGRKIKYNIQLIRSKAAALVLVLDFGIQMFRNFSKFLMAALVPYIIHNMNNPTFLMVSVSSMQFTYLLYPIGGLIADSLIGRYRMIVVSMYTCFITWVGIALGFAVFWFYAKDYNSTLAISLLILICITQIGVAGFQSNIIPFNIDQLMGASGDQLSAIVNWHMFVFFALPLIAVVVIHPYFRSVLVIVCLFATGIAITIVILSHSLFKHWLDPTPHIANPIKLIIRVLNYARKNKYPRNRSALTYWENTYPSRLDLGKKRYGGPFSEEEVEDVKTVLRLLPVFVIAVLGFPFAWDGNNIIHFLSSSCKGLPERLFYYYVQEGGFPYTICILSILLYQFLIYPCFYKYIPSMLKRIGLGLVFALLTSLGYISILLTGYLETISAKNETSSIFSIPLQYQWLLLPQVFCGFALFLVPITSLEFTVAQSPGQMRGLMVGVWYAAFGLGKLIDRNFSLILYPFGFSFTYFFYSQIANTLFILIALILFLIIAKHYKFRIRDNIVPVHQIAEEHYERYYDQSEEYRREYGLSRSDVSIDSLTETYSDMQ